MTTGERIKILREKVGITQEEFSQRLGTTRNTITNYEANRRMPMDATIKSICREFGVDEEWLRTGEGEMFTPTPENSLDRLVQEFKLDSLDREIISEFVKLDDKSREVVKLYIKRVSQHLYLDAHLVPEVDAEIGTINPSPDTIRSEQTEPDLAAKVAELERQNQALAAEIAAMKEDDAGMEAAAESSAWPSVSAGNLNPVERTKK